MRFSTADHFRKGRDERNSPLCTVRLQSDVAVHGILKSRFPTQKAHGCFSGNVPGRELNLPQFASRLMAKGLGVDDARAFANGDRRWNLEELIEGRGR